MTLERVAAQPASAAPPNGMNPRPRDQNELSSYADETDRAVDDERSSAFIAPATRVGRCGIDGNACPENSSGGLTWRFGSGVINVVRESWRQ